LFLEPNPADPLNKEAAQELKDNRPQFIKNVKHTMNGGFFKGETYDRVTK
jgi:ubiquitin-conjugating enzyme E2 M